MMVDCVENVKYDELVEIHEKYGRVRLGKVLEAKDNTALVPLFVPCNFQDCRQTVLCLPVLSRIKTKPVQTYSLS